MSDRKSVMVIGAGRFGSKVAVNLLNANENVLLVDKNSEVLNKVEDFAGYLACFDALDCDALIENGINEAKMVIIATDSDDVNIFLADICNYIFSVPFICVKLDDSKKKNLVIEKIKVIAPFELSIDDFNRKYEDK